MNTLPELLLSQGYSPIPILPNSKNPGFEGWQTCDVAAQVAAGWPSPQHGTGLRTGLYGFLGMDIDSYSIEMIARMKIVVDMMIPEGYILRTGQAPKILIPLVCLEITKKMVSKRYRNPADDTVNAIEVLSTGQQFIIDGIHPDTLQPYTLSAPLPPLNELPVVSLQVINAIIKQFEMIAVEFGWEEIVTAPSLNRKQQTPREYAYNQQYNVEDLLIHYGWTHAGENRYTRPGKSHGVSATVTENVAYCFTSSSMLEPDQNHRPYDIVTAYAFNGDEDAMIKHAVGVIDAKAQEVFSTPPVTGVPSDATINVTPSGITLDNLLEDFEVKQEYVDGLGEEVWLYPNLVILGHILVIIAMAGGAKTAFFFREVVPHMVRTGMEIFYVDADSPVSEHKDMKRSADEIGFKLINPNVNLGTGVEKFLIQLHDIVNAGVSLTGTVFIFDTLKKFTDLMSKSAVKDFFSLCRTMNSRGATTIFLAHANKYRDADKHLVPEGVGDVKNDADDLILFERKKNPYGGINVTTVVDIDQGAKTRGIFEPFSFYVNPDRDIQLLDTVVDVTDHSITSTPKATDDEILDAVVDYLRDRSEPIIQSHLSNHVKLLTGAGLNRVKGLIVQNATPKESPQMGRFVYTIGGSNSHLYELPPPPTMEVVTGVVD